MKIKLTILTMISLLCGISVQAQESQIPEKRKTEREKALEYFTQKALSMRPASQVENESEKYGITEDWRLLVDDAQSHPKIEDDSKIIRLADGTFAGICTLGDPEKIYAARLVKLAADGKVLWSKDVDGIMQAEAKSVAQGTDGSIYVAGRMVRDNAYCAFVAQFASDGTQKELLSLDDGQNATSLRNVIVKPFSDGVVYLRYASSYSAGGYVYKTYYTVLDKSLGETRSGEVAMDGPSQGMFVIGNDLVVASTNLMCGVNLATGQELGSCEVNSCLNAVVAGSDIYVFANKDSNQAVVKFTISDGKISQEWVADTTLPKTVFYSMLAVNAENEVVAAVKNFESFEVAKISAQGKKLITKYDIFQSDNALSKSFCYGMDFDDQGNVILTGMGNNFQVYIAKLNPDLTFKEAKYYIIGDPAVYSYSYMRDGQPIFFDGKMACACYVRVKNRDEGHFPYFAQWNLAGETSLDWAEILQPGDISSNVVLASVMDSDGNILISKAYDEMASICKYSPASDLLWVYNVPYAGMSRPNISYMKTLADGSLVFLSDGTYVISAEDFYLDKNLVKISPDGKQVWSTRMFADGINSPEIFGLEVSSDNEIYVVAQDPSEDWTGRWSVVEKYDGEGSLLWSKNFPDETYGNVAVQKTCLDADGNLVLVGNAFGDDGIAHPSVMKVTKNGDVAFHSVIFTDKTTSMSFVDVWTDQAGNILCAGGSEGDASPLYAAFDTDGRVLYSDFDAKVSGYYCCVGSFADNAVFSGVFADGASVFGRVLVMDPQGKEVWSRDYRNGNAVFVLSPKTQPLVFAGYAYEDNNNVREVVVTYGEDGSLSGQWFSDIVFNPSQEYALTSISGNADSAATTSYTCYAGDVKVGFLTRFVYKEAGIIGVEAETAKAPAVELERYGIDGHRLHGAQPGVNIVRMSDGTSRKVIVK